MKKAEFHQMVMDEINHLKTHATLKEIGKLDFDALIPESRKGCIYGQMTGCCFSERAIKLYNKKHTLPEKYSTFMDWKKIEDSSGNHTPLEVYIMLKGAKNKQVIQYLKGEINTLKL